MQSVAQNYPVVNQIFEKAQYFLADKRWGDDLLAHYYARPQVMEPMAYTPMGSRINCDSMTVKLDTHYHTIKQNAQGVICVLIK